MPEAMKNRGHVSCPPQGMKTRYEHFCAKERMRMRIQRRNRKGAWPIMDLCENVGIGASTLPNALGCLHGVGFPYLKYNKKLFHCFSPIW